MHGYPLLNPERNKSIHFPILWCKRTLTTEILRKERQIWDFVHLLYVELKADILDADQEQVFQIALHDMEECLHGSCCWCCMSKLTFVAVDKWDRVLWLFTLLILDHIPPLWAHVSFIFNERRFFRGKIGMNTNNVVSPEILSNCFFSC